MMKHMHAKCRTWVQWLGFVIAMLAIVPLVQAAWVSTSASGLSVTSVGTRPQGLATHTALRLAIVANEDSNNVSLVNLDTGDINASIPLAKAPREVAVDSARSIAYVLHKAGQISVINLATGTFSVQWNVGEEAKALALNTSGSELVVAAKDVSRLVRVDTTTGAVTQTIPLAREPKAIAFNADGTRLFVATDNTGIRVFNTSTWAELSPIALDDVEALRYWTEGARLIAVDKRKLYLVNLASNGIQAVAAGVGLMHMDINGATGRAYLSDKDSNTVALVNLNARTYLGRFVLAEEPSHVAFDPSSGRVFATFPKAKQLLNLNPAVATLLSSVFLGEKLTGIAVDNENDRAVAITEKEQAYIVDLTDKSNRSITLPADASALAIDEVHGQALLGFNKNYDLRFLDLTAGVLLPEAINLDKRPEAIAVDDSRGMAIIAIDKKDQILLVDTATRTLLATLTAPGKYKDAAVHRTKGRAYIVNRDKDAGELLMIDLQARTLAGTIALSKQAEAIVIDEALDLAVVAVEQKDKLEVVDLNTNQVIQTHILAKHPQALALNTDTHTVVIAAKDSDQIALLDLATQTLKPNFATLNKPMRVGVSERFNQALVITAEKGEILFIQLPNPAPVLTEIVPPDVTAPSPSVAILAVGKHFIDNSKVYLDNQPLVTRWKDNEHLEADVPVNVLATAGIYAIKVVTPAPGGGESQSLDFTVQNPIPALTALAPLQATAGGDALTLNLTGERFVANTVVHFGAQPLVTTFIDAEHVSAAVPATLLAAAATVPVRAFNPVPGGGYSNVINFTIIDSGPRIDSITPTSGEPGTTVTINGGGFDPALSNNKVRFGGNVSATVLSASATQLVVPVPANAQTGAVVVETPRGTVTGPVFTVNLEQDFALVASPATLALVQNASNSFAVHLTSTGTKPFVSLVRLSADGLPNGVTAEFSPPAITGGGNVKLVLKAGSVAPQTFTFNVVGSFDYNGNSYSRLVPATVTLQQGGQTGVKGRFVTPEGQGIGGVYVRMDSLETTTDAAGNFQLLGLPAGSVTLRFDATPANPLYPIWPAMLTLEANKVLVLEDWVLVPPPADDKFTAINNVSQNQIVSDPRYPGFEVQLPAGVTITGWDGVLKTRIAVERVEPAKMGLPPPPFAMKEAYQLFFGTPMGGIPSAPIPMRFPNVALLEPGQKTDVWYYDGSPMGGSGEWKKAGQGTVSADGKTVLTDPGAGIPRFCGKCGFAAINCPPPPLPPEPSCPNQQGGNPVDLYSGQEMPTTSGLRCGGLTPIETGWSYNPVDAFGGRAGTIASFGFGWTFDYDISFLPFTDTRKRLILPGGIAVNFVNDGTGTYRPVAGQRLSGAVAYATDAGANEWEVKFKDGRIWHFRPFPGIPGTIFGGPPTFITEIIEPTGTIASHKSPSRTAASRASAASERQIRLTYGANGFVSQLDDVAGRSMSFTYTSTNRIDAMTDASGGVTSYTYVDNNEIASAPACAGTVRDYEERIKTIQYPGKATLTENFYGPSRRVLRQTGAAGEHRFAYKITGACVTNVSSPSVRCTGASCPDIDSWENFQAGWRIHGGQIVATTVTDPQNNSRTYAFNARGATTAETGPLGELTQYRLDLNSRVAERIDPLGRSTRYEYNAQGNRIREIDPDNRVIEYDYDAVWNKVTEIRRSLDASNLLTVARMTYHPTTGRLATRADANNRVWSYAYTPDGQLETITDPRLKSNHFTYNDTGDLIAITDPTANTYRFNSDVIGRTVETVDALGFRTGFFLNTRDQREQIVDARLGVLDLEYDIRGNLKRVTNQNGRLIQENTYDENDRLLTSKDGANETETFTYDTSGNPLTFTDRRGQTTTFTHDENNRLTNVDYPDGTNETRIYDTVGRLASIADANGVVGFQYDNLDRVVQVTSPQGWVKYGYDILDRRIRMETPQQIVTYDYDNEGNLRTITQGSEVTTLEYDENNSRSRLTYPNGIVATYVYDDAGRLTDLTYDKNGTVIESLSYLYDPNGRVVERTRSAAGSKQESSKNATYDPATNRLLTLNGETFAYDDNGNLATHTNSCGATTYTWNAKSQLTEISGFKPDCSALSASFTYDALGRRTQATIDGNTTTYLHDGLDVITEIGARDASYVRTDNIDEAIARYSSTGNRYLLADMLGSTLVLTDPTGVAKTIYAYSPYGETEEAGETTDNPTQYTGRENDDAGLYYYRARYYAPGLARFILEDPIGFGSGYFNLYNYVGGDPLVFTDPTGECPWCIAAGIGALTGAGVDLALQLLQNGGDLDCVDWKSVGTAALSGAALSGLGPTGFVFGRGGSRAAQYGYSKSAGLLNSGSTRFGWGYRAADDSNVLRGVINGNKYDIPGTAISPLANPLRDGAVSGALGGGTNRATNGSGDSCGCKE